MTKLGSVDEVLDFAMDKEQEAADFYLDLAARMDRPAMQVVFRGFAKEEMGHKAKLQAIKDNKDNKALMGGMKRVLDLKLSDYLVDVEPRQGMEYSDALILAMKNEKAAFRLYSDLAATTDNAALKETFLGLAQEEAKHKLRFEIEYDDHVMTEN